MKLLERIIGWGIFSIIGSNLLIRDVHKNATIKRHSVESFAVVNTLAFNLEFLTLIVFAGDKPLDHAPLEGENEFLKNASTLIIKAIVTSLRPSEHAFYTA